MPELNTPPQENQPPQPEPLSIGTLFSRMSDQVSALIEGEIALAKAKAKRAATSMGLGGALLVVAGLLALFGLGWMIHALFAALLLTLPAWAAALVTSLILFLIAAALALIGKTLLSRGQANLPQPQTELKKDLAVLKDAIKKEETNG